ncbi:MAG: glucosaminidase domain-containing protein [Halorhodospira sp.]
MSEESRYRWLGASILGAAALGAGLAGGWVWLGGDEQATDEAIAMGTEPFRVPELEFVEAESSAALLAELRERGNKQWLPEEQVAPVTARAFPPDLPELEVSKRKELFFRVLMPMVLAENARLREARAFVEQAFERREALSEAEQQRLAEIAEHYRVDLDAEDAEQRLLRRVDEVAPAMALAQAANESGWGTSRFTRKANNLFGEWTWTDEGLVPEQREEGKTHRVRLFPSLQHSVRSYIYLLNVGHSYQDLRAQREALRQDGEPLDGEALSEGLEAYSERGSEYVEEIQSMIRFNDLDQVADLRLQPTDRVPLKELVQAEAEAEALEE